MQGQKPQPHYEIYPARYWIENRRLDTLTLSFLEAHHYVMGAARNTHGELTPESEDRGFVGIYNFDHEHA